MLVLITPVGPLIEMFLYSTSASATYESILAFFLKDKSIADRPRGQQLMNAGDGWQQPLFVLHVVIMLAPTLFLMW